MRFGGDSVEGSFRWHRHHHWQQQRWQRHISFTKKRIHYNAFVIFAIYYKPCYCNQFFPFFVLLKFLSEFTFRASSIHCVVVFFFLSVFMCVSLFKVFPYSLRRTIYPVFLSLSLSLSVSFLHSSCHLHIFDAKSVLRRCDTLFSVDFVSSSSETVCLSYARFFLLWKECQHRIGSCVTSVMCCQKYVVVVVVSTEKSLIIRRWRRGNEGKRRSKKRASMYE